MDAAALNLRRAIEAIESKFAIGGTVEITDGVTVTAAGNSTKLPVSRGEQRAALSKLVASAETAPFGHKAATVVDESVRRAKQVKGKDLSLDGWEVPAAVLERIRSELVPDAGAVEARLHKLCLYEEGGHFAKHRDTPRSETQFGSLVVALPTCFEGGELKVQHEGKALNFNWGRTFSAAQGRSYFYGETPEKKKERLEAHVPRKEVAWAAYFADAEHEVVPVTSGARLTLTYELHRDAAPDPNLDALLMRAENVRKAFAAVAEAAADDAGGSFGYACKHLYEEKAVTAAERALAKAKSATVSIRRDCKALKNEDAVVACAAKAAGFDVDFLRIVADDQSYSQDRVVKKLPAKGGRGFGVTRTCDGGYRMKTMTDDDLDDLGELLEESNVTWITEEGAKQTICDVQYSGEGYFGNEASSTTFYAKACLLINAPSKPSDSAPLTADRVHDAATAKAPAAKKAPAKRKAPAAAPAAAAPPAVKRQARGTGAAPTSYAEVASDGDDGDDEDDDDYENNPEPASSSAAAAPRPASSSAAAPPQIFAASSSASSSTPRTIHVVGGQGNTRCSAANGATDVVLSAGQGIAELKKEIRRRFGKYAHHTMGTLQFGSAAVKKTDLVDGATVRCTYTYTAGNANFGGHSGRRGGFGGGHQAAILQLMLRNAGLYF